MNELEIVAEPLFTAFTEKTRFGLYLLGCWAIVNMLLAIGLYLILRKWKYFFQMTGFWNLVNLSLCIHGIWSLGNLTYPMSTQSLFDEILYLHNLLLFNLGLDVGYLFLGAWFIEKSEGTHPKMFWKGYGYAIIVQAVFLLLFDGWFSFVQHDLLAKVIKLM